MTLFKQFPLHAKILKALEASGYSEATPIQERAIPKILEGVNVRASAQTGTGKTAAFLLPGLNLCATPSPKKGRGPRMLILAPTRELAMQIAKQAEKYSRYMDNVKTVCISGGVPYQAQERKLARPHDILIATPGRLIDFLKQKKIHFSRLEILVLDEADRMLDMGFVDAVEEIVEAIPNERQTLLFSATMEGSVLKLSKRLMETPVDIKTESKNIAHQNIAQSLHYTDNLNHKNRLLDHLLTEETIHSAIIFTATKRYADQLVDNLYDQGHKAASLHRDMSQRQRTRTIRQLHEGKIQILVATDVAARGIDVQSITHVINFDLPRNIEDYVHRIGRTGRAGAKGKAISFASCEERSLVKRIEEYTKQPIECMVIKGFEPSGKLEKPKKKKPNKNFRFNKNKAKKKGPQTWQKKARRPRKFRVK